MRRALITLLLLSGCSPNSLEDYRQEGESFSRTLIEDFKRINTRDELLHAEPLLKKRFEALADLMIAAREHQRNHPEEESVDIGEESGISDALLAEIKRIYSLEGGREVVERAQREPLIRLDAYEKTRLSNAALR